MKHETITYEADGLTMHGKLVFEAAGGPRPGVLVFPEAFGLDQRAINRAEQLAELGYIALGCDLHGEGRVVEQLQDAMAELRPLFEDPNRTRARALGALQALITHPEVDPTRVAAIGFCFPAPLELARSGADLRAIVGFHTSLGTKLPVTRRGVIKGHVLVCIGYDDPFITASQRAEFESEMRGVGADWEMNLYGGTVHSFTNQEAALRNMPEAIRYNPESHARAWASGLALLERTLMQN